MAQLARSKFITLRPVYVELIPVVPEYFLIPVIPVDPAKFCFLLVIIAGISPVHVGAVLIKPLVAAWVDQMIGGYGYGDGSGSGGNDRAGGNGAGANRLHLLLVFNLL